MNTNNCEVIRDLLPLYIDNVCSDESRRVVAGHLKSCDACKKLYEDMRHPVKQDLSELELDSRQAFKEMNRKWRIKKISIICVSILLTAIVCIAGYMVVQNVSSVHDYFFPTAAVTLRDITDDEWHQVNFTDTDVLVFDSSFYKKKVTLDANSDAAIRIRVSDTNGKIILGEKTIQPGTDLNLDMLEKDVEYIVEVRGNADFICLNFD